MKLKEYFAFIKLFIFNFSLWNDFFSDSNKIISKYPTIFIRLHEFKVIFCSKNSNDLLDIFFLEFQSEEIYLFERNIYIYENTLSIFSNLYDVKETFFALFL